MTKTARKFRSHCLMTLGHLSKAIVPQFPQVRYFSAKVLIVLNWEYLRGMWFHQSGELHTQTNSSQHILFQSAFSSCTTINYSHGYHFSTCLHSMLSMFFCSLSITSCKTLLIINNCKICWAENKMSSDFIDYEPQLYLIKTKFHESIVY